MGRNLASFCAAIAAVLLAAAPADALLPALSPSPPPALDVLAAPAEGAAAPSVLPSTPGLDPWRATEGLSFDPHACEAPVPSPTSACSALPVMDGPMRGLAENDPIVAPPAPARNPLYATQTVETSQYFSQYVAADLSPEPGPEVLLLTFDGFLIATNREGNDLWRLTPVQLGAAAGLEIYRRSPVAFTGYSLSPYTLTSHQFADTADVTGDGYADVLTSFLFFEILDRDGQRDAHSKTAVFLVDGVRGTVLWAQAYDGFVRNLVLADVNGDGVRDRILSIETGSPYEWRSGWMVGNAQGQTSRVEALDGKTGAPLWTFDTREEWTFVPALAAGDLTGDDVPDVALAWVHRGIVAGELNPELLMDVAAIDGRTGGALWTVAPPGFLHKVLIEAGRALVMANGKAPSWLSNLPASLGQLGTARVHAYDGRGAAVWTREWPGSLVYDVSAGGQRMAATMITLYPDGSGIRDASLRVHSVADGSEAWAYVRPADGALPGQPTQGPVDGPARIMVKSRLVDVPGDGWRVATILLNLPGQPDDLLVFPADASGAPQPRELPGDFLFLNLAPTAGWVHLGAPHEQIVPVRLGPDPLADPPRQPFVGLINAVERRDLNGDGAPDLLAAGDAGLVYALDGAALPAVRPLWSQPCGVAPEAGIHELVVGRDAAGTAALFAVADDQICRLDLPSGRLAWHYDVPPARLREHYVRVRVADVNGDLGSDLVVPGSRVFAIDGKTGTEVWSFGLPVDSFGVPPTTNSLDANLLANAFGLLAQGDLNGDGRDDYAFEYATNYPRDVAFVAALDGRTGEPLWTTPMVGVFLIPLMWDSTAIGDLDGDGQPEVVAVSLRHSLGFVPEPVNCTCLLVNAFDGRTGAPRWQAELPQVASAMNGVRLIPRPDGTRDVLVFDIFSGMALVGPRGQLLWEEYVWQPTGARVPGGVAPWDVETADFNGDGTSDVAYAAGNGTVGVVEGDSFHRGAFRGLYSYRGLYAGGLTIDSSGAPPQIAFTSDDFRGWAAKNGDIGASILGVNPIQHGLGLLSVEPPAPSTGDLAAPPHRGLAGPGPLVVLVLFLGAALWAGRARRA